MQHLIPLEEVKLKSLEDEARSKELNATVALRKAEAELAKEKNKEAIRRMFDPERVFSNRIDTVEEEARAGGGVWDILGRGIDFFLGRNGEADDEELPVW